MRIQFAEPVKLQAAEGHREFDAYGRRFSVDLQRNERLVEGLSPAARSQLTGTRLMRGKLQGMQGSWVRLTQVGAGIEGAIWDGQDLYVVTSLASIQKHLTTPVDAAPTQTVVYRLSDTLDSLPEGFCGLDDHADAARSRGVPALKQYRSLVTQLAAAAATTPAEQLSLALIADTAFQQRNGATTADAMLARLNVVDGIFAEQIGVLLQPTELRLVPANSNPFTTTDAGKLLDQLSNFRSTTPEVRTAGLAHLFTGKDLDGNTIGIAYRDALCDPTFGVSLSDDELDPFGAALIMAHELGHNFGAGHDGAAGGACEATGSGYLMWPQYNGSSTFSACSRSSILQSIEQARGICIVPAQYADLSATAPVSVDAQTNTVFTLPVTVRSIGNLAATGATLRLSLPTTLTFQSSDLPDGACNASGSEVICDLGDLPVDSERVIALKLMSRERIGTSVVTTVRATNDYRSGNGTTQTVVRFTSGVDLGVAMTVSATTLYANDTLDITLDISSTRTVAARGGILSIVLSGLEYESATAGAHTCTSNTFGQIRCDLADIPAGETTRIVVHAKGKSRGQGGVFASVQVADDGDYANNHEQQLIEIIPENDLLISASIDSMRFEPDTPQEVTYIVSAIGRIPTPGSQLQVWAPWNGVLDSATGDGSCALQGGNMLILCDFGDLNPGDTREVTVRFHTTSNGGSQLQGAARYNSGPNTVWTNTATTQIYSNLTIDAVATTLYAWAVEGLPGNTFAGVESVGLQPAQNVVATLEVPSQVQLTALSITNASGWTCSLLTPQRGRCTGAFTATGGVSINYSFISNIPGDYTTRLTITADGDANVANDVSESPLLVGPYLDAGITTTETQMDLVGGQDHTVGFTVTTGARPVPAVGVVAWRDAFEIVSMTAAGVACTMDAFTGFGRCELGDLPANAAVPVSVTYRATTSGQSGTTRVSVYTQADHNPGNNSAEIKYTTIVYTDLRLQVAQTTASAVSGTRLNFPRIEVSNLGAVNGQIAKVQIPLPDFTTVESVSGTSVLCTGTTTLVCELWSLSPGTTATIDIALRTSATGNFTSNVTLQSYNDSTTGNNDAAVQLSVTAAQTGGGSSGGGSSGGGSVGGGSGKGGGGRLEWLALGFFALLLANRARRQMPGARRSRP